MIEALWEYPFSKAGDTAADAAWGEVLKEILDKARVNEIGLDSKFVVNLWNSWILQAIMRITDQSVTCYETHKFPAWECNGVPQVHALEAQLIR